ncbi:MAG: electron transfer flavoprotein beta subunit [Actinomycetota bacterium]|jgi:electron transfer flavoprotein beta subunit|nr:electron transfer flavoprotein beta subunit [Actinomycetota bacterium]
MADARRIAVLVKSVPSGGESLRVTPAGLSREGVTHAIDPLNEVGIEWALRQRELGTCDHVVAVLMGPPDAGEALRRALSMGADDALHVSDPALTGADVRMTARVLAAAVQRTRADVVVCGYESLDGSSGTVPAALAAALDWPLISRAKTAAFDGDHLQATCDRGRGPELWRTSGPAVLSLVDGDILPRYPKVGDMLRTRSRVIPVLGVIELHPGWVPPTSRERVIGLETVPVPSRNPRIARDADALAATLELVAAAGAADA